MKYSITEKKALKKLGIPDFRHMTKDKVVQFTSMIHKIDPEVAKAAIEQFPEFRGMATDMVNTCKEVVVKLCESNNHSQDQFYSACNSIISSLQKELEMPDLSSSDCDRIENKMIQVAEMIGKKDSENKKFLRKLAAGTLALGALFAGTAAAILGSNSQINAQDGSLDDEEDEKADDMIDYYNYPPDEQGEMS